MWTWFVGYSSNRCLLLFYTIIIHRGLPIVVFTPVEAGSFIVVRDSKTPLSRCGQIMGLLTIDVERSLEVSNVVYGCKITHTLWNRLSKNFSCLQTCPRMDSTFSFRWSVVNSESTEAFLRGAIIITLPFGWSVFVVACPEKVDQVPKHTK